MEDYVTCKRTYYKKRIHEGTTWFIQDTVDNDPNVYNLVDVLDSNNTVTVTDTELETFFR